MSVNSSEQMRINEVLCFILNKFGKSPNGVIKSAVVNFYNWSEVTAAKDLLWSTVEGLGISNIPRYIKRKADDKLRLEVDDLFSMITFLDEGGNLTTMPKFVALDLFRVPVMNSDMMDLSVVLGRLRLRIRWQKSKRCQ